MVPVAPVKKTRCFPMVRLPFCCRQMLCPFGLFSALASLYSLQSVFLNIKKSPVQLVNCAKKLNKSICLYLYCITKDSFVLFAMVCLY